MGWLQLLLIFLHCFNQVKGKNIMEVTAAAVVVKFQIQYRSWQIRQVPPENMRYVVMKQIDLIHDTCPLCMHIRGDNDKSNLTSWYFRGQTNKIPLFLYSKQVPLFSQIKTMILVCKMYKIIEFLLTVMTSTLFTRPLWRFNSIPYWPQQITLSTG